MPEEVTTGQPKPTLGLTGLTSNAMALIAPGAFLWLTFLIQAGAGKTAPSMWWGIVAALLLCLATAVSYAEISKLFPGIGSSYYYAEQALLSKAGIFKFARIAKFIVGWGSHLYYWVYPGVMVATTGIFVGYIVGFLAPNFLSASNPGPLFMGVVAVLFSFFVAWIAQKGATASTTVNLGINIVQISALLVFSVLAIHYRVAHPSGTLAHQYDAQTLRTYDYEFATKPDGTIIRDNATGVPQPLLDATGKPTPFHIAYPETDSTGKFLAHPAAKSVIAPHGFNWVLVQTTIAILILVGFESVTAMGGEAKNPSKHIPIAVLASLLIQGSFYLFEYFAANYFLNSGYTMQSATGSAAPIGDMMIVVGDALLGEGNGKIFMLVEAVTVFLALIGTTLACMNTGARVTYAMSKDDEAPEHFGLLHDKTLSPRSAIWTLAGISAVIGVIAVSVAFGGASTTVTDPTIAALPHNLFSSFGYPNAALLAKLPNTLLMVTLTSNFGTFILYALTCFLAIVAYHKHPNFNFILHLLIPGLGLIANLACMGAYLVLPYYGVGTILEPRLALCLAGLWGLYGAIYFIRASRKKNKPALLTAK